jgi:glycosyltransferase involved in cell wall biosynthesis
MIEDAGAVVFRRTGQPDQIDAIDEYSHRLARALAAVGVEAHYLPDGPASLLATRVAPSWVLLQYNPFRYGRAGIAPGLVCDLVRLRRRSGAPLAVMVHEAWIDMRDARSSLIGLWQRAQLRALLPCADLVMTSTEALARQIGKAALHVPVASNITPVATSGAAARAKLNLDRRLIVALFGRAHESRAPDYAEAAIAALADSHAPRALTILNLGADAPPVRIPPGVELSTPGALPAGELSLRLWASDIVLLPLTDGVSTRRGTLMAALAHGRPVLALHGHNTDSVLARARDALALTPVGDPSAYARAAVSLTADRARLREIGDAGRRLYESHFDWPVLARTVASALETVSARQTRPRPSRGRLTKCMDITFVANDVGGGGGMELQSAELVSRLLDAGHRVTVIARTCGLPEHGRLRFMHVRTPRRPAAIAYPSFMALASVLAASRRGALLHTTGAIVCNRADISTIHFLHRAVAVKMDGSRASKPSLAYRLNSAVAGFLSRAGEAWCYRPGRTRLLCAVSRGLAAELHEGFPLMRGAVRVVPNGVDASVFRPDPGARERVRAELGLDETERLALFVGGDWERKGLRFAADALPLAARWHLMVAGGGDPAPLTERARQADAHSRLHFLGQVRGTPRLYAAADAFVLPSAYETFSLVTFEAASSGVPLLVTRVSGVEDLLDHGSNGWFISRDAGEIAMRLDELIARPELARTMGTRARSAASRYSWETMAEGYRGLYAELSVS